MREKEYWTVSHACEEHPCEDFLTSPALKFKSDSGFLVPVNDVYLLKCRRLSNRGSVVVHETGRRTGIYPKDKYRLTHHH